MKQLRKALKRYADDLPVVLTDTSTGCTVELQQGNLFAGWVPSESALAPPRVGLALRLIRPR